VKSTLGGTDFLEEGIEESSLSPLAVIAAGGTAGMTYNVSTHCIDVAKSLIQSQPPGTKEFTGTVDCIRKIYRTHGMSALFRGIVPNAIRAFPANAIGFLVYEWTLRMLPRERL